MDALQRFRDLAEEFRRAARSGDAEGMAAILRERRSLLRDLAGSGGDDPRRTAALREILELDRESETILERRRGEMRSELVALGQGRRGLHGYGGGSARASKWIDERG